MEKFLKALLVIGLLIMPWRYYFWPQFEMIIANKQMSANIKASISRFADGREAMFRTVLQLQKENIGKEKYRLEFMLPSFSKARANLMSPFENLRTAIPGEWHAVPEGKFKKSGPLVFWPFRFTFSGSATNAVRVLAGIETSPQLMLLRNFEVTGSTGTNVTMKGVIELVFHSTGNDSSEGGMP